MGPDKRGESGRAEEDRTNITAKQPYFCKSSDPSWGCSLVCTGRHTSQEYWCRSGHSYAPGCCTCGPLKGKTWQVKATMMPSLTPSPSQTFIQNLHCEGTSRTQRETSCSPYPQGVASGRTRQFYINTSSNIYIEGHRGSKGNDVRLSHMKLLISH